MTLKKILSAVLAAVMIAMAVPVGAITDFQFKDGFAYSIVDGNAIIINPYDSVPNPYSEKVGEVVIPQRLDGAFVRTIDYGVFGICLGITKAVIPNTVTTIDSYAFYMCMNMKEITIPDSIQYIGDYAFYFCAELESIKIPAGIKSIGDHTFHLCESLTEVVLPSSITSIGDYGFAFCHSLETITVSAGVQSIADNAFDGCENLTIKCYKDSVAHAYAVEKGIPFELIHEHPVEWFEGDGLTECESYGYDAYVKCSECDYTTYSKVSRYHNFCYLGPYEIDCFYDGYIDEYICTDCGYYQALGYHMPEHLGPLELRNQVPPTCCTKLGYTGDYYCLACGLLWKFGEEYYGRHVAGEWVTVTEATYSSEGLRTKSCAECGEEMERETVPKLPPLAGDADGDGAVDISDVTAVLKYIAKWNIEISEVNADVTGDGIINVSDVTAILRDIASRI